MSRTWVVTDLKYTVFCALCCLLCVLCTVYCALCTVHCVLCTVHCVKCTVCCVLCTVYCALCTVYCVLWTVYCVLCTVCCVLCTLYYARDVTAYLCWKWRQKRNLQLDAFKLFLQDCSTSVWQCGSASDVLFILTLISPSPPPPLLRPLQLLRLHFHLLPGLPWPLNQVQ